MSERPGGGGGRRRSRRDSASTSDGSGTSMRSPPSGSKERRTKRPGGKPVKERWLLTRKTWRYMADAGRRLIPEGIHNKPEDIPKIEQYFQEVCQREPRFLLWRKASYPGSLLHRAQRPKKRPKGGSCRVKASSSADESLELFRPTFAQRFAIQPTTAGKFDLERVKREWLAGETTESSPSSPLSERKQELEEDEETKLLADMLQKYLNIQNDNKKRDCSGSSASIGIERAGTSGVEQPFDYQSLIDKLQQHLDLIMAQGKGEDLLGGSSRPSYSQLYRLPANNTSPAANNSSSSSSTTSAAGKTSFVYQGDYVHKSLLETINRHYRQNPNRQHMISNILTDRKLLEKLYFDLRCTRNFRGPRATGTYANPPAWWNQNKTCFPFKLKDDSGCKWTDKSRLTSPPPLIAVQEPSTEKCPVDSGIQTDPVAKEILDSIILEREREEVKEIQQQKSSGSRRRSSVDNDDVSPSVSDTIKRYLRMARKKSMDGDKADRFKRVNYDRNLRNIKAKGEITKPGDDDGNSKGCQTEDNWAVGYRDSCCLSDTFSDVDTTTSPISHNASSRSSIDGGLGSEEPPSTPKHHQSFFFNLLHGHSAHKDKPHSAPGSPAFTSSSNSANSAGGSVMQKSKSSSSVVHHGSRLVAKKIFRSRSKSSTRLAASQPCTWTPQGKCTWAGAGGRRITLADTPLRSLSEVERKVLCQVAVAKLQALNLGVVIRPPSESLGTSITSSKPKRRAYLLKKKSLTTGFFDSKSKDDNKDSVGGLVFGIPLAQCLENDRLARVASGEVADVGSLTRNSRHGSRTSCTSLIEHSTNVSSKNDESGSCESISSKGGTLTGSDSGVLELSDGGGGVAEYEAVPGLVKKCIDHLRSTGLKTLGLFRVSASKKRVRQLREDFDCGRESKIGADQCPHDVATLLKEFFRDLPDPLLCRDLYQAFVHTQKIRNRRLQQEALQYLVQLLPTVNRETLWALLTFLGDVASNSEDFQDENGEWQPGNKMDITNLATVFAPNILHCIKAGQMRSEVSVERAEERIDVINVVRALLEHASSLFTIPAALLDELYLHMMDTHPAELDLVLTRRTEEQGPDEGDPCSEAELQSVEETIIPGTPSATTRKIWSREQFLHQTAGTGGGDIGPRPRRSRKPVSRRSKDSDGRSQSRSNSIDSGSSEDRGGDSASSGPMVITASLTIPSGAFTLNLDDTDIPYIEEIPNKQPITPVRRQRNQSISAGSEGGRHGSDSAVGSSATLPSSPPSWASSPPGSPDSTSATTHPAALPISCEVKTEHITTTAPSQSLLQRLSFSSDVKQQATSTVNALMPESSKQSSNYSPSITSIGGAVMRSKTADIERMLQISRSDSSTKSTTKATSTTTATASGGTSSSAKKYTKRRYTDSRHTTRHIPDAESLAAAGGSMLIETSTSPALLGSSAQSKRESVAPIWKRRELISSAPKHRDNYF